MGEKTNKMSEVELLTRKGQIRAYILAGGFGKRLGRVTDHATNIRAVAKPAVPVGSCRAIDYSLRSLVGVGVKKVDICVGYLSESLKGQREGLSPFDLEINFHYWRQESPTHTLGTIVHRLFTEDQPTSDDGVILVLYGDIVHNIDLRPAIEEHIRQEADATIVVNPFIDYTRSKATSLVLGGMPDSEEGSSAAQVKEAQKGWITNNYNKAHAVIKMGERVACQEGIGCLSMSSMFIFRYGFLNKIKAQVVGFNERRLFDDSDTGQGQTVFSGFGSVFSWLTNTGAGRENRFFAYIAPPETYCVDIGLFETLKLANADFLAGRFDAGVDIFRQFQLPPQERIYIGENTVISSSAKIVGPTYIGENVVIEDEVEITRSVIREGNRIRKGAIIRESVLFPQNYDSRGGHVIGEGVRLSEVIYTGGEIPKDAHYSCRLC